MILLYEFLLGSVASCFHPLVGLLLACGPLLFLTTVARPFWAYGLFIVAIQFSSISFGRFGPFQIRVVDVGFFFLLALFLVNGLTEKRFVVPRTGIDASLWFFVGWMALSFTWSLDRNLGIEGLIKIFIGVLTFYITVYLISGRYQLNLAMNMWILAGVISGLAAIYEFQTIAVHHITPGMTKWATPVRSQGFFGGPIMLGSFLTLSVCINYGLILRAKTVFRRVLFITTCGIMIIGLLTTLSRNDIAAWFLVTAFFNYRFKQMRLPTAVVLAVILIFGFFTTGGKLFTVFWNRFFYVFEGLEVSSQMRVDIWLLALKTILNNPLLGVGLGGFPSIARAAQKYGSLIYPHSLVLYVMVELGIIGFVLLAYLAVRVFRFVRVAEKGLLTDSDKAIGASMTAGLLVHIFWALTQNITFQHIIFWAFLGISFASYHVLSKNVQGGQPRSPVRKGDDV